MTHILVTIVFIYNSNHIKIDLRHLLIGKRFIIILLGFLLFPTPHAPHPSSKSHKGLSKRKRSGPAFLSQAGKRSGACLSAVVITDASPPNVTDTLCRMCYLNPAGSRHRSVQISLAELPGHKFLKEDPSASYSTLSSLDWATGDPHLKPTKLLVLHTVTHFLRGLS